MERGGARGDRRSSLWWDPSIVKFLNYTPGSTSTLNSHETLNACVRRSYFGIPTHTNVTLQRKRLHVDDFRAQGRISPKGVSLCGRLVAYVGMKSYS